MADEQVLLPRGRYESLLKKIGSDKEPLLTNEEKNPLVREEKKSPRMELVKPEVEPRLKSPVNPPVKSAEKLADLVFEKTDSADLIFQIVDFIYRKTDLNIFLPSFTL